MTLYLDLPGPKGKLDRLIGQFAAEVLPAPPRGLGEVPPEKALVCLTDMGRYEAAGYIITEQEFAAWTEPGAGDPKTWLVMDRATADGMCLGATEHRTYWQSGMERDAEAAAHRDNLIPVARASRSGLWRDAMLLREYAAALRTKEPGSQTDTFLTDLKRQRIAAADLDAIARDLESWAGRDWVAVIDIGPDREHLAGPLPPFPEAGQRP